MGRAYCADANTVTVKSYNLKDEDPKCLKSYLPETDIPGYTAKTGDCFRISKTGYASVTIVPAATASGASYFTSAILASVAALVSITIF